MRNFKLFVFLADQQNAEYEFFGLELPLRKENFSDSSIEELEEIRTFFLPSCYSTIIPLRGADNSQTEGVENYAQNNY